MVGGVGGLQGTLAEFVSADANLLARKPTNLSMREAAALPLITITAWEGLVDRAKVHAAQTVLIHAGAGGVGHIAIQIARAFGAQVFATVSGVWALLVPTMLAVGVAFGLILSLAVALPVAVLAWTSFLPYYMLPSGAAYHALTTANYASAFSNGVVMQDALRTAEVAAATTAALVLFTFVASYVIVRGRGRFMKLVDGIAAVPLLLPALVLSLGILDSYIRTPLYDTSILIGLAFFTCFIPYGVRFGTANIITLSEELEECAYVSGVGLLRTLSGVVWPLVRRPMLLTGGFLFLAMLKQLTLVILLAGPSNGVVMADLFRAWTNGEFSNAAAISMLLLAAICVGVAASAVAVFIARARSRRQHAHTAVVSHREAEATGGVT